MKRKEFIKATAALGSGLFLSNYLKACVPSPGSMGITDNFGLQLYTLRDVLPSNPVEILKQVASFGYKQIESYEHDRLGMFWGMKHTEFKKLMDDLGMKLVASHCDMNKNFEQKCARAAEIGMNYLICPHLGPQKTLDHFKRFAENFNQKGETCKKNGLKFAYHNHDYSFVTLEGQFPQDVMMQNTDKDLVEYEMDIYWVVTAGQDPLSWLNRYPDRFTLSHVKDRKKGVNASQREVSVTLGTGSIDYKKLLPEAAKKGMHYFLVEQEAYENTSPIKAVEADAIYMKKLTS